MTAEKDHIPALDGLRGLAALAVVAKHLGSRSGPEAASYTYFLGTFGVLLFFTLSGFLMSYLYASKSFTFANVYSYAVSRISRILPVYLLVVLLAYLIYSYVDGSFVYALNNENILRHLLLSGNVSVFWSIPPEIQFYFFFVFFWWAMDRFSHGRYWPMLAVILAVLVMLAFVRQSPGTTLPSKLHIFMLGVIAGRLRHRWPSMRLPSVTQGVIQAVLLLLLLFLLYTVISLAQKYGSEQLYLDNEVYLSPYCTLACAMTVLFFSYSSTFANAVFGCRPMRLLGAWSFAIYLIHEPFLQIGERLFKAGIVNEGLAAVLAVGASIGAAAIVHICFEKPVQAAMKKQARSLFALIVPRMPESDGAPT